MYPNNEGPRTNNSEETLNAQSDTFSTQQAAERNASGTAQADDEDQEALTTRTPERWWLRKRLMQ